MNVSKTLPLLAISLGVLISADGGARAAQAQEAKRQRQIEGQASGPRGTVTGTRQTTREPGALNRSTTISGANGKSTTLDQSRQRDRAAGTASANRTRVFGDGTTRQVDKSAQRGEPGQVSGTRTVTGRDGQIRSQSGSVATTRTENGFTRNAIVETERGAASSSVDVARTDTGFTRSQTTTGPDGNVVTRNDEVARDPETGAVFRNRSTTFPDGTSALATTTRSVDPETGAATKTVSGATRAGEPFSGQRVITRTENGVAVTRTVTGPNGETRTQTGSAQKSPDPQ